MNHFENRFKTASVGGFVKSEVIGYIESMEQEYMSKLGTLERIVAVTQASRSELEGKLQQREKSQSQIIMENKQLKSMIAEIQTQFNGKEQALQAALTEVERMQSNYHTYEALQIQLTEATSELEQLRTGEMELQEKLAEQGAMADEATREENVRLQMELDNQRDTLQRLNQENAELREKIEEASESIHVNDIPTSLLLDMQTQLDQRNRQLITMNHELELTREKCQGYEITVGALDEAQTRAENIESEAHQKASAMLLVATQESDKLKRNLVSLLGEIDASYQKVAQDAERKVSMVYAELEKTKAAVEKATVSHLEEDEMPMRPSFSVMPGYGDAKNA